VRVGGGWPEGRGVVGAAERKQMQLQSQQHYTPTLRALYLSALTA